MEFTENPMFKKSKDFLKKFIMISIKKITISVLVFSSLSLQAQIQKGTKSFDLSFNRSRRSSMSNEVGGMGSNNSIYSSRSLNPTLNFFIKENIALKVGLNAILEQDYRGTNTSSGNTVIFNKTNGVQVGGNIGVEKWFPIKALDNKFYLIAGINTSYNSIVLGSSKSSNPANDYDIKGNNWSVGLYLKLSAFITPKWNAHITSNMASYHRSKTILYNSPSNASDVHTSSIDYRSGLGYFNSSIGISYFFNRK